MRDRSPTIDEPAGIDIDRRRLLQTLGVGSALVGFGAGSAAADEHAPPKDLVSGTGVHPVFGFAALAADVEPPAEPDHEIEALIREREGAEIPEFYFEPTGLYVDPGDTVRFTFVTPHHTVTAYHPTFGQVRRVPKGVAGFSSPVLGGGAYWLYTFDEEGVYDYHCGPHEIFGHAGRIVAGSATGPGARPVAGAEDANGGNGESGAEGPRPPLMTAATVLDDPALDPDCIVSRGRVGWDDVDPESKALML